MAHKFFQFEFIIFFSIFYGYIVFGISIFFRNTAFLSLFSPSLIQILTLTFTCSSPSQMNQPTLCPSSFISPSTESIIISLPFFFPLDSHHKPSRSLPSSWSVSTTSLLCWRVHPICVLLASPKVEQAITTTVDFPQHCPVLLIVNNTRSSTSTCFSRPEPEQSPPVTLSSQSPSLASLVDRLPLHHHLQSSLLLCGC